MGHSPLVILGAGASREYGGPLMRDFVSKAQQVIEPSETYEGLGLLETVIKLRKRLRDVTSSGFLDLENVEDVLSIVDTAVLADFNILEEVPSQALSRLYREFVARTVESCVAPNLPTLMWGYQLETMPVLAQLNTIVEQKHKRSPNYITFNYDLTLEHSLLSQQIHPQYSRQRVVYPPLGSNNFSQCSVAKLHGSVSWFTDGETEFIVHPHSYLHKVTNRDNRIRLSRDDSHGIRLVDGSTPLNKGASVKTWERILVAPSLSKVLAGFAVAEAWKLAHQLLTTASHIYIIGYSWPKSDAAVRHLLTLGMAQAEWIEELTIVCPCGPDIRRIEDHFRSLLGPATQQKLKVVDTTLGELTLQRSGAVYNNFSGW